MSRVAALTRAWRWVTRAGRRCRLTIDEAHLDAMWDVLRDLGATVTERDWAVAGAVERSTFTIERGAARATMTCDSYEGARIVGDRALIDALAAGLARR